LYLISSSKFKADLRLLVCKRVVSKREIWFGRHFLFSLSYSILNHRYRFYQK
jgi:hypothetical protein